MKKRGFFLLAVLLSVSPIFATIWTVSPGSSIQTAINGASSGDTIVVNQGIYYENLNMKGKAITLTSSDPNDPSVTILDGGGVNSVILCTSGEGLNTVIRGFTLQNGNAQYYGGGIQCFNNSSPTIQNCIFIANNSNLLGGGIFCYSSNPMIANCRFYSNTATQNGGGMDCYSSNPTIMNCLFSGNDAGDGGGIASRNSSLPTIINCSLAGNTADSGGGLFCDSNSDPIVINSIFWGNAALSGAEIKRTAGNDPTISYSVIPGCGGSGSGWNSAFGIDGGGNMDADPNFLDANGADDTVGTLDDNLHIDPYSVCINAGDPNGNYTGQLDMDLAARVRYDVVDIGADEVYYVGADLNQNGEVSVADLILFADTDWLVNVDYRDFALFATQWGYGAGEGIEPIAGDLNGDGQVDLTDLMMFVESDMWLVQVDLVDFSALSANWLVGVE